MIYLLNSFSLQMLDLKKGTKIKATPISVEEAKEELRKGVNENAVGHEDTAVIVGKMLDTELHSNRINVKITPKDTAIVAQLTGGRLPEGATTLPEGYSIEFVKIELYADWEVTYVDWDNSPMYTDNYKDMTYDEVSDASYSSSSGAYDRYIVC